MRIHLEPDVTMIQPDGTDIYYCAGGSVFRRVSLSTGDVTTTINPNCGIIDHQGNGYYRAGSNDGALMRYPLSPNATEVTVPAAGILPVGGVALAQGARIYLYRRDTFSGTAEPSLFAWSASGGVQNLVMGARDYYSFTFANGEFGWWDHPPYALFSVPADGSHAVKVQTKAASDGDVLGTARAGSYFYWGWNAGSSNLQIGAIYRIDDGAGLGATVTTAASESGCAFRCVTGFAADPSYLYWSAGSNNAIRRVAVGSTSPQDIIAPTTCEPGKIFEYGTRLYWVEDCGGSNQQYLVVLTKPS